MALRYSPKGQLPLGSAPCPPSTICAPNSPSRYAHSPGLLSFRPQRGSRCGFSCGPRRWRPERKPWSYAQRASSPCARPTAYQRLRLNEAALALAVGKPVKQRPPAEGGPGKGQPDATPCSASTP